MAFGYNYQSLSLALILFWQSNLKMMVKNIYNEVLQIYRTFCSYDSGSTGHFISKALFVIGKKLSTNFNFYQLILLQQVTQFDLFWICAKLGYSQASGFFLSQTLEGLQKSLTLQKVLGPHSFMRLIYLPMSLCTCLYYQGHSRKLIGY